MCRTSQNPTTRPRRLASRAVAAYALALFSTGIAAGEAAGDSGASVWPSYLDQAHVYVSEEPEQLRVRLSAYADEAGVSLTRHLASGSSSPPRFEDDSTDARRTAIAELLRYLATGERDTLEQSADAVRGLEARLGRFENRFWYHYVLAHLALERDEPFRFVEQILAMWLRVVVPLEGHFETFDTLALGEESGQSFAGSLPYVYENLARLILLRSQAKGLDRDLDPLEGIVRLLDAGRLGGQPDVIPPQASSRDYARAIVRRLDGPASDDGSLTFTLALIEAERKHARARTLLGSGGLDGQTLSAIDATTSAYELARDRAETAQGRCAVYTRALRLQSELYSARQRTGIDPEVETPFSIEGAIRVYSELHSGLDGGWPALGYRGVDRDAYLGTLNELWYEIQEASLNAADYYLSQSAGDPERANERSRDAARILTRFLSFFEEFATPQGREGVPDSAYFAAFEAAKGFGDAHLLYASRATGPELELATARYLDALALFPFDRHGWSALADGLGRHGREDRYLDLVRPTAEAVGRSRPVEAWVQGGEPRAAGIAAMRAGLADSMALMYLGFLDAAEIAEKERGLVELGLRRDALSALLSQQVEERDAIRARPTSNAPPASADGSAEMASEAERSQAELARVARNVVTTTASLERLEAQIEARSRALPLYKRMLEVDGLSDELRSRPDHPVHTLLRRMYYEDRP